VCSVGRCSVLRRFDVLEGGCGLERRVMFEECKICEEGVMWEEG
jgi:hypothetical protein